MKTLFFTIIVFALIAIVGPTGFVQAQQPPSVFRDAKPRAVPTPDARPALAEGNDAQVTWPKLGAARTASNTLYTERLELLEKKLELLEKRINDFDTRRK